MFAALRDRLETVRHIIAVAVPPQARCHRMLTDADIRPPGRRRRRDAAARAGR